MKRKIKYTSEPLGDFQIVKDFLPKPDELVLKERMVRVTLQLNKFTVEYFKKNAGDKNDYRKVISQFVNDCTEGYSKQ